MAAVRYVTLQSPRGVQLTVSGSTPTLAPGATQDLWAFAMPDDNPRPWASDATFSFRVETPSHNWDFSFPLQVKGSPPRCGKLGEPKGPDGCCTGTELNPFNNKCETPDDSNCGGLAEWPRDKCCRHTSPACRRCTGTACSPTNQPQCVQDGPKADDLFCELRPVPPAPACKTGSPVYAICHVECDHSGNITYGWACSIEDAKQATERANGGCEVSCESSGLASKAPATPTEPPSKSFERF